MAEPTAAQLFSEIGDVGIKIDFKGLVKKISELQREEHQSILELDEVMDFEACRAAFPAQFTFKKREEPHFNPRSTKHLTAWFGLNDAKVPHAFNEQVLEQALPSEQFEAVMKSRRLRKRWGDLQTLRKYMGLDGRMHVEWSEAKTGRWYTGQPNIQTMAKICRQYLVPEEGNVFFVVDWAQQELRWLAHLSQEPFLLEAFERGEDAHLRAYTRVTGQEPSEEPALRKDQRDLGKLLNYALIYGQEAPGLGAKLRIPNDVAQTLIDRYFAALPKLAAWREWQKEAVLRSGFVTTASGRQIPLVADKPDKRGQTKLERAAVNYAVQGSAADQLIAALRRLHATGHNVFSHIRMTIHDALLVEVPKDHAPALARIFALQMEVPFGGFACPTETKGPAYTWAEAMDMIVSDELYIIGESPSLN